MWSIYLDMPSIRITQFAGLLPEANKKALRNDHAQIAHNCLLQDGWLRPMPVWTQVEVYVAQPASLVYASGLQFDFFPDDTLYNAIYKPGEPYTVKLTGVTSSKALSKRLSFGDADYALGVPLPTPFNISQVVTNQNLSVYPVPRTYAVTLMSGSAESAPYVFSELGTDGTVFEGDVVTLGFSINLAAISQYYITGYRLYRTIPGFDTAEQLGNPTETGFHLVYEAANIGNIPTLNVVYADVFDSSAIPGDLLLTEQFMPPHGTVSGTADFLMDTESGWLVYGIKPFFFGVSNFIQVSERYLWDAWPPQNTVALNEDVQAMVSFYDDVFIGTSNKAYHMRIDVGENDALNIVTRPFTDSFACTPRTMVTTNFGAMYASPDGLVALEANGDRIASTKVTNPGDLLGGKNIRINSAQRAAWWNGSYFGLCIDVGYVFTSLSSSTNEFPLAQLVTIDVPSGIIGENIVTGYGLFSLWGNVLYDFPLPGYGYDSAVKATYTWRSKRYVLPGLYTMAAAKVVHDGSGPLTFKLFGDGQLIISRSVATSEPFRIPHQHKCIEWEIEVSGSTVINEIHVATSVRDLVEEPGSS